MATQNEILDVKRRARRRLVGAIALVLFLIVVPPLVMDLEPRSITTTLEVDIPEQKDTRLLPPPAPQPVETPPEPAPPPAPPSAPPEPPAAKPVQAGSKPVAPTPAPVAVPKQDGYAIAMATYTKKDNVVQAQTRLKEAGFKSYTETVKSASGEQTRVRAGPFSSREAADKARAKLQQLGMNPGPVTAR